GRFGISVLFCFGDRVDLAFPFYFASATGSIWHFRFILLWRSGRFGISVLFCFGDRVDLAFPFYFALATGSI
ncbi:MAG: hypothetical protein LBK94_02745, partial [Prevotellaceae bacterium]|nr:hypothetical protein [Prevotellaceae bacterium]